MLTMAMVLCRELEQLATVLMLDLLDMPLLDMLDMLLPLLPMDIPVLTTMDMASVKLKLLPMLMPTPLDRYIMDSPLPMPMLLAVPTMLELSLEPPMLPLPILDMLVLAMLVSEILDMLLPLSPMVIPDLTTTDMASVKLKLILMLTQLDRLHMDSLSPMPSLLAMPTMLELSLDPPMLPLPILDMLDMLDIMPNAGLGYSGLGYTG